MQQLTPETQADFVLADATLQGLRWHAEEPHLSLDLDRGGRAVTLTCRWARDVRVDLSPAGGPPLSWECKWDRVDDRWRMQFDFAAAGVIRLECSDATLG